MRFCKRVTKCQRKKTLESLCTFVHICIFVRFTFFPHKSVHLQNKVINRVYIWNIILYHL